MSKGKFVKVVVLPVLAVCAMGFGGYQAWLLTAPPMPETVEDVESLLVSGRYQRLSKAEKRPYLEHMNEMWSSLDGEKRKRLRKLLRSNPTAGREAGEQRMRDMYKVFATNQSEIARNAVLDGMINAWESAEGQKRHKENLAKRKTAEGKEQEDKGRRKMMEWLDKGDPQTMGYGSEFMKMLEKRRKERGLPPL